MSIQVTAVVWNRSALAGTDLLIMLALSDWADDTGGNIFPSVKTLARKCRTSDREIQRTLAAFLGLGLLKVTDERQVEVDGRGRVKVKALRPVAEGEKPKGGRGWFTAYRIVLERLSPVESANERVTDCHPSQEKGDPQGTERVTGPAGKGDTQGFPIRGLDPSVEPSMEPSGTSAAKPAGGTPSFEAEFEEIWRERPPRDGGNSRHEAFKAFKARRREGIAAAEMLEGLRRYTRFQASRGKLGTAFVKTVAAFLGPSKHFLEPWDSAQPSTGPPGRPKTAEEQERAEREWRERAAGAG